ncbi:MAG: methyltransferase domain-containing protein [Deltaproteobacteria bacterium]|nr:methyltransferase domain-containing protein [Deltaproteobacteria bacterium]
METAQLEHWKGQFGNEYTDRCRSCDEVIVTKGRCLEGILTRCGIGKDGSVLEVGANVGTNLKALRRMGWSGDFFAVEPNGKAYDTLVQDREIHLKQGFHTDGFTVPMKDGSVDLVFTCGVLIHVHPDDLLRLCSEVCRVARSCILCMEYFSPNPEGKAYRGRSGLLFKRDFGGFYLDHWPHLRLVDYGFLWKRVSFFDDVNWWLFRKEEPGRAP